MLLDSELVISFLYVKSYISNAWVTVLDSFKNVHLNLKVQPHYETAALHQLCTFKDPLWLQLRIIYQIS